MLNDTRAKPILMPCLENEIARYRVLRCEVARSAPPPESLDEHHRPGQVGGGDGGRKYSDAERT
jgi:hypothetical protein